MPKLGLHTNTLDFDVLETNDPKTLTIVDKSQYMDTNPDKPIMDVLVPGTSLPISISIRAFNVTVITSHALNLSCGNNSNMPDGVYKLTYRICPQELVFVEKYYLKLDIINYELDNVLLMMTSTNNLSLENRKRVDNVFLLLAAARAHTRNYNILEATRMYQKAQKELNKIKCK